VKDGRYVRKIYHGIQLTELEQELLANFKQWLL